MKKGSHHNQSLQENIRKYFSKYEIAIPTDKKPVMRLTESGIIQLQDFLVQYGLKITKI